MALGTFPRASVTGQVSFSCLKIRVSLALFATSKSSGSCACECPLADGGGERSLPANRFFTLFLPRISRGFITKQTSCGIVCLVFCPVPITRSDKVRNITVSRLWARRLRREPPAAAPCRRRAQAGAASARAAGTGSDSARRQWLWSVAVVACSGPGCLSLS